MRAIEEDLLMVFVVELFDPWVTVDDDVKLKLTPPPTRLAPGVCTPWLTDTLYPRLDWKELLTAVVLPTEVVFVYCTKLPLPGGAYSTPTTMNLGLMNPDAFTLTLPPVVPEGVKVIA